MAISRIPGYSLLQDLDRQGTDLKFTTNSQTLTYLDFTNFRLGVNTATPQQALEVVGNILVTTGNVYTGSNVTYNIGSTTNWWNNVYAKTINGTAINSPVGTYTQLIAVSNVNPSAYGTGTVGTVALPWANVYSVWGNFTNLLGTVYTASQPYITGLGNVTITLANIATANIGNLSVTQNYVTTGNITANLITANVITEGTHRVLTDDSFISITGSDGTGNGIASNVSFALSTTGVSAGVYGSGGTNVIIPQITVDAKGRVLSISNIAPSPGITTGNITFANTTISSNTNMTLTAGGNIYLTAGTTGQVQVTGNLALGIPFGNVAQRPSNPITGDIRYNTEYGDIEWWTGSDWSSTGSHSSISSVVIVPDGVSTNFDLGKTATTQGSMVSINGTLQTPGNAYVVTGSTITFAQIPLVSDLIEVRMIDIGIVSVESMAYGNTNVTLTTGQVNFGGNLIPWANVTYNIGSPTAFWQNFYANTVSTVNPIAVVSGGTGAATPAGALTNLLPGGATAGYVLTTGGAGSYYWSNVAGTGGGSSSAGGYRVNSARLYTIATNGQTLFNAPDYVIGSDQLRVYINGVRQFDAAYTETSGNTFTLSAGVSVGTQIMAEVDSFVGYTITGLGNVTTGTWSANTLSVQYGGTGSTTLSSAVNNLLSGLTGPTTGYVLTTGGSGTYYWAAPQAGAGTVGQTLNTTRQVFTATASQTLFTLTGGRTYTPGTGQLRVYIGGVRQYATEYTETGTTSFTLTVGVNSGDLVLAEIDAFNQYTIFANMVLSSNTGTLSSPTLTVQDAINSHELNKAALAGAVFTGNISVADRLYANMSQAATSLTTGAIIVPNGGIAVAGNIQMGGNLITPYGISLNTANLATAIVNGVNGFGNIGSSTSYFNTVFAKATSAQYADVAEKYLSDSLYPAGIVVEFGGNAEVQLCDTDMSSRVAGVISTNPAYLMNDQLKGKFVVDVALLGRVPCFVYGPIRKGDMLVSAGMGYARAEKIPQIGTVIGKALENFDGVEGTIEIVVGRL